MKEERPLAETMRPTRFEELVGQSHLTSPQSWLRRGVARGQGYSLLLYGPPGCGKTSFARIYARSIDGDLCEMSAVDFSVKEVRSRLNEKKERPLFAKRTLLFVDEIHRLSKAQQDVLLPYVENGEILLIAASCENPSVALSTALLSRLKVVELAPLNDEELRQLIHRYEAMEGVPPFDESTIAALISYAAGDGRLLFSAIEALNGSSNEGDDSSSFARFLSAKAHPYDRSGDQHYNLISAFHKSIRGSDPDAALYWLARMVQGGEDPLFIARRMIRMAVEDIGLADPRALEMALAARQSYHLLGSPEGELALAQVAVYLALAPKSNSIYLAYGKAQEYAKQTSTLPPPKTILNGYTNSLRALGWGKDYRYDHDERENFSGQHYFPTTVERQEFYHPKGLGFERDLLKRKEYFAMLRQQKSSQEE